MIHGMTGFGRGEAGATGMRVTADARSTNHRYLDVELRGVVLPAPVEARVRKAAAARLGRGRLEVTVAVELTDPDAVPLRVDRPAMHALISALRDFGSELAIPGDITLSDISRLPWTRVVTTLEQSFTPAQEEAVAQAIESAIAGVVAVRSREGEELEADFSARLEALRGLLDRARDVAAGTVDAHAQRLRARIAELAAGVPVDEQRLAHEVALLADRSDVAEELTRLEAYIVRLREIVRGEGPSGKRLDFTLQEAFREVNTIGSKARTLDLSAIVIEMKTELERMREQAANVE